MKKFLLILIILTSIGLTSGFESDLHSLNQVSSDSQMPEYNLEIENTDSSRKSFSIYVHEYQRSNWYNYDDYVTLNPGESENVSITVDPDSNAVAQSYGFEVSARPVNSDSGQRHSGSFKVVRENGLNVKNIDVSENYRPGKTVDLTVNFQNVDSSTSEYKEIQIKALEKNYTEELGPVVPGGEREISKQFQIPDFESPGQKNISVSFDGRTYRKSFNIEAVENITSSKNTENRLIAVTQSFDVANNGNENKTYKTSVTKPSYLAPVVHAPEAEKTETENGVKYEWNLNLAPGESKTAELRTDYWIPLTGLIAIFTAFLGLKKITSSVSTKKTVNRTSEGLDIKIEVENNSSKTFDDVLLKDYVPNIAEIDSSFEMASPEINNTDNGTKLKWWLTELEPGDQRILKYSIRPKVEVEEGITLESAILKDGDKVLSRTKEIDTEFRPSE